MEESSFLNKIPLYLVVDFIQGNIIHYLHYINRKLVTSWTTDSKFGKFHSISSDGSWVLFSGEDDIKIVDFLKGKVLAVKKHDEDYIKKGANILPSFLPESNLIAITSVYDVAFLKLEGNNLQRIKGPSIDFFTSTRDKFYLHSANLEYFMDVEFKLYDKNRNLIDDLSKYFDQDNEQDEFVDAIFTPDNRYLIVHLENLVFIYDLVSRTYRTATQKLPPDHMYLEIFINCLGRVFFFDADPDCDFNVWHLDLNSLEFNQVDCSQMLCEFSTITKSQMISEDKGIEICKVENDIEEPFIRLENILPDFIVEDSNVSLGGITLKYVFPYFKIIKLLPSIMVLKKSLTRQHPMSFPTGVIFEIVSNMIKEFYPDPPVSLINFLLDFEQRQDYNIEMFKFALLKHF